MSSANQQPALPYRRGIVFSSPVSLISLLGFFLSSYVVFWLYKNGAKDQEKYIGIMSIVVSAVVCGLTINRALTLTGLSLLSLRSIKIALILGVIQAAIGVAYAYALYFSSAINTPFRDALFQAPVILAIGTCVVALYSYLFYTNISQTRLLFLSVTLTVIEIIVSLIVFIILALWVLSKNIEMKPVTRPR
jgi:hypothetical protein